MTDRHEQQPLSDAAFDTFWSDPQWLEQMKGKLGAAGVAAGGEATAPAAKGVPLWCWAVGFAVVLLAVHLLRR